MYFYETTTKKLNLISLSEKCPFVCSGPFHPARLHPGILLLSLPKKNIHSKSSPPPFPMQPQLHSVPQCIVSPPFPAPHPRSSKVQRIHTNEKAFKIKQDKDPYCKMLNHSSEPERGGGDRMRSEYCSSVQTHRNGRISAGLKSKTTGLDY